MDLPLGAPILAEDGEALGTLGGITIDPLSRTVKAIVLFLDQALVVPAAVDADAVREGRATTPSTSAAGIVRVQAPLALVRGVSGKTVTLALDLADLRRTLAAFPDVDAIAGVPLVLRTRADGSLDAEAAALPDTFVPDAELDGLYPADYPGWVEIAGPGGRVERSETLNPSGAPGHPGREAALFSKYDALAADVVGEAAAERLKAVLMELPRHDAAALAAATAAAA